MDEKREVGKAGAAEKTTYDYYIKELQPFSRKSVIPDGIIENTVKVLIEIGDITPAEVAGKKLADTSYLPR